jgi:hypothetical protein
MPYQWIDPELFLEHQGVAIYHCYDDYGELCGYWYTTDPADDNCVWVPSNTTQFDVRDLSSGELDANDTHTHATIIRQAIEAGLITGEPAAQEPPIIVKIAVRDGVAHVVEQPPGVAVELIVHDQNEETGG